MKTKASLLVCGILACATMAQAGAERGEPLILALGNGTTMELVWIPPGEFDMGDKSGEANEQPVHRVRITRGFWMGKYEVTQEQYGALMGDNPSGYRASRNPVENVNWADTQAFLAKLNEKGILPAGCLCRLPTEAQWEYACRAGTATKYYTGNSIADLNAAGWYGPSRVLLKGGNSGNRPHAVGQKRADRFGLYDMIGNVWEWCADWYGPYQAGAGVDPKGPASGTQRVRRGGAFPNPGEMISSACRGGEHPDHRTSGIGFRVCCAQAE
jgi:formylglycine-generating enzyme required for sulfatase activity